MYRPRVIPVLLLQNNGLVKSVKFKNNTYIGDPLNAVRIYNDLKVDEIVLLDIDATKENRTISIDLVKEIGEEANMPFSVGGGIKDIETIQKITSAGAEKVILNSFAIENPNFVKQAAENFGSSTICVCIDYKKKWRKEKVYINASKKNTGKDVIKTALEMQNAGAGEVIIQSIDRDGSMAGYDIEMIKKVSESVTIPVVALGGAGTKEDIENVYKFGYANGLAAGSFFVFKGTLRGVLIQYPEIKNYNFSNV